MEYDNMESLEISTKFCITVTKQLIRQKTSRELMIIQRYNVGRIKLRMTKILGELH